jgi:hypothetical protein
MHIFNLLSPGKMKNYILKTVSFLFLVLGPFLMTMGQPLPSPIPNPGYGSGGPVNCGQQSAPIEDGYWILMALALAYSAYCTWKIRKAEKIA